jgi:hypothetical protein
VALVVPEVRGELEEPGQQQEEQVRQELLEEPVALPMAEDLLVVMF